MVDPTKVSLRQLDDMKIGFVEEIGQIVSALANQAKRKDGVAIINRIVEDLEQILLIGQEQGRREEAKRHDKVTR